MRHPAMMMDGAARSKIEADMAGVPRPPPPRQNGGDDYPHLIGFPKRVALCEAQNHRCGYCGVTFNDPNFIRSRDTIDHVVPRVAGGLLIWSNEIMACDLCNQGRGAMYARQYFAMVVKLGRWEAYQWARRRQRRRDRSNGNKAMAAAMQRALDKLPTG